MVRFRLAGFVLVTFSLSYLMVASGCGGGADKGGTPTQASGGPGAGATKPPTGAKTPVEGKGVATLKGKVTIEGGAPAPDDLSAQIMAQGDKGHCLKEDPMNPEPGKGRNWVVNSKGEVANVVVWVSPPAGKYFKFSDEDKKSWEAEANVDQPFCHFVPHVRVAFPEYYDGETKKMASTGQKVKVLNSAPISHNTNWKGGLKKNPGTNVTIPAKGESVLPVQADTEEIRLACDIHKWMSGYIWPLDTPYAAVTKEDGTFEIKNVPAGAEVVVIAWHEVPKFFGEGGRKGKAVTLKEGDNEMNFSLKAK